MLGSPTVQTALGSMLMGPAGARTVATPGGSQVPVGAVTNLLGMLAGRASARYRVPRSGRPPITGRVVLGVERLGGRPRIRLIATEPRS